MGVRNTSIVILITFILLALIETGSWVSIKMLGKQPVGLFWGRGGGQDISDPCNRFIFDPQLGYIHDDSAGCKIRNAEIDHGFVHYLTNLKPNKPIRVAILGGSTTDGYFQHTDGFSWPFWFNQICNEHLKETPCDVYNGGVGAFSSSRELRKLFRDVVLLKPNPAIVISLNGINDMTNHDGPLQLKYPYYDSSQLTMFDHERFPPSWDVVGIFPNTLRMLKKVLALMNITNRLGKDLQASHSLNKKYETTLPQASFAHQGELWKKNVELMNGLAKTIHAEYLVFVQPTMGLSGQNPLLMTANDQKLFAKLDKEYLSDLNETYRLIKKECKSLSFCIDISDVLSPDGQDIYHDPRHPNAHGNKIIATRIFEELRKRNLLVEEEIF